MKTNHQLAHDLKLVTQHLPHAVAYEHDPDVLTLVSIWIGFAKIHGDPIQATVCVRIELSERLDDVRITNPDEITGVAACLYLLRFH